jgi:hypothetical protein
MKRYNESIVQEILAAMPRGLTLDAFMERCRPDINAGCKLEVLEAGRRYFKREAA